MFLIWCGSGELQTVYLSVSVKPLYFPVNSSQPPLIKGETTVSEGDTLHLTCDVSNSHPLPSIKWVYPGGQTFTRDLEISNTTRYMTGTYTCIATHTTFSDATVNISVHITILCKCVNTFLN